MNAPRQAMLLNKANNFVAKLKANEYTDDGKAVNTFLYHVDTMIYSLAGIDNSDWRMFLKELKEAKSIARMHSRDQNIKKENFNSAVYAVLQTLDRYIGYLQLQPSEVE